jgi:hypothetical protein
MTYSKTVGSSQSSSDLDSLRHESIERMKLALLSASLDNPTSTASAIRQVTIMRVYHQVTRIVEYLDLMDTLETNLYRSIRLEMNDIGSDESNLKTITKLLTIQEKLQKSIIESNKLLQPFVESDNMPMFNEIEANAEVLSDDEKLLPSEDRSKLRENANEILKELKAIDNESSKG